MLVRRLGLTLNDNYGSKQGVCNSDRRDWDRLWADRNGGQEAVQIGQAHRVRWRSIRHQEIVEKVQVDQLRRFDGLPHCDFPLESNPAHTDQIEVRHGK